MAVKVLNHLIVHVCTVYRLKLPAVLVAVHNPMLLFFL